MRRDTGKHGEHICSTEILRKTLSVYCDVLELEKGYLGKKSQEEYKWDRMQKYDTTVKNDATAQTSSCSRWNANIW